MVLNQTKEVKAFYKTCISQNFVFFYSSHWLYKYSTLGN